jgi:hypothetical protein
MANIQRNFIAGRMNKSLELRLLPNGEYTNAVNVRLGSTEQSEIGSVENSKGNTLLTDIQFYNGTKLSDSARCIGVFEDGANETLYWFVHDPAFTLGATGKLDIIVSYNVQTGGILYHLYSIDNGGGINTTLNFNPEFLITGINKIDNLLFFTDNTNPPRVLNIDTNYENPAANNIGNQIDQFDEREIQVVKQPPFQAPTLQLIQSSVNDTFLTDNFICFGYRYRYSNAEYSATSQFSEPAFQPKAFDFSAQSFANDGMTNRFNAVIVTFNSGSQLVKGVDILYKLANDSTIRVIERIIKKEKGFSDNTNYTFEFDNSKIFSVLPESEILRTFDNVPTLAKAQTLMANRLVFGNYVEGYNLKDTFNEPLALEYTTSLVQSEVGEVNLTAETASSGYTLGGANTIPNSALRINFDGNTDKLIVGATISFSITYEHNSFSSGSLNPDQTTGTRTIQFSYVLIKDLTQSQTPINDLISQNDFIAKFGLLTSGIQTLANAQNGAGTTFTDVFNSSLEGQLGTNAATQYDVNRSGRTSSTPALPSAGEGIAASVILPATLQLQILAAEYEETGVGTNTLVEYYKITNFSATLAEVSNTSSLHSNRGYEVGIIYMDSFNRASTALVSTNNTLFVGCNASSSKNEIQINIPITQRAPSFATRYKFCIKADRDTYDTIYTSIFYEDDNSNNVYFLLEGDNIGKVKDGDRLIVKRDIAGPLNQCTEATVLEVVNQPKDFITVTGITVIPAGVYMKMNNIAFQAVMDDDDVVDEKVEPVTAQAARRYPILAYPFFLRNAAGAFTSNYTFPIGTRVVMRIEQERPGTGNQCEPRTSILEQTIICSDTYAGVQEFFDGEDLQTIIQNNATVVPDNISNEFITAADSGAGLPSQANKGSNMSSDIITVFGSTATDPNNVNYYRLYQDTSTSPGSFYLLVSGTTGCAARSSKGDSQVRVDFTIYRRDSVVVFETEPKEALPDLWYESAQTFEIDSVGNHLGNVQNQDISAQVAGVVLTDFSNCFAFGNGVESYKILDESFGGQFNLGNRTFTTSNTTFQKAHRFADLTYSGVFNDESNVNKLNEFNLGLANFKPLEETFGDVEILYARRDDILVLQEDKISYVLAGKDLLSDASGNGQLLSVPEVLGKQIARIEDYGISNNPESFAVWGEHKYFTDAKRSAVINLIGSSAANEQLKVISEAGMRSWFRDLFTAAFTTQKLGGYDPYMNEYVLTSNTILKPEVAKCTACGVTRDIIVPANNEFIYCVDLEEQIGDVLVSYVIPDEGSQDIITELTSQDIITEGGDKIGTEGATSPIGYTITAIYDGVTTTTGVIYTSGSFTFDKNSTTVNQVIIEVTSTATVDDTIEITVGCPSGNLLNLYSICVTDAINAGEFIHNEASWSDGSLSSATQSNLVPFGSGTGNFVISQYNIVSGNQGVGLLPTNGSVMTVAANKINFDDFVFNSTANGFGYLRTDTTYANNITDITTLLGLIDSIPLNTSQAPTLYSGAFTVPTTGNNLYIVYDYRNANPPTPPTPNPPTPTPTPTVEYKQYQQCNDASIIMIAKGSFGYTFPDFIKFNGDCYENHQSTSSVSNTDITTLLTFADCPACQATVPVPTPVPTSTFTYREYSQCDDSTAKQIFRFVDGQGLIIPTVVKFNNICYGSASTTGSTSSVDIPTLTYSNCSDCQGIPPVPTPSPTPTPTPSPTPTPTPVPTPQPQLFYRLIGCPDSSGSSPQDCYYQSPSQPAANQRFVDGSSGSNPVFYRYSGDVGQTSDQGLGCQNIQPVGTNTGCPPVPAPVAPSPQPSPNTFQDIEIQECYQGAPTYNVRVTNLTAPTLANGLALTLLGIASGGNPGFDGTKYWVITNANANFYDSQVTFIAIQSSCGGFQPAPTAPIPSPPPQPTTVYAQYLICDGNDVVAYVSGAFGTTFPNVLKISGICYEYSTLGGSSGPDYTNYDDFNSCSLCEGSTPTPSPTPPPSPTCFAINNIGVNISSAQNACNSPRRETHYFNNSSLCQATVYYGTNSSCSPAYGAPLYVADGSYSRYWSGSSFSACEICQQQ